jgi:hypothetical protein
MKNKREEKIMRELAKQKTEDQLEWDLQCYGTTEARLRREVEDYATLSGYPMMVASIMSDAQTEMEFGMYEKARQSLNRAKFILFNYVVAD